MLSADHGHVIFETTFETQIEKADFFQNPVSIQTSTYGLLKSNDTIFAVKLNIANSTAKSLNIVGRKKWENHGMIRAIKQKASFKAVLQLSDELEVWSQDLTKREFTIQTELGSNPLVNIIQMPSSLAFHSKREIGFYRLNTDKNSKSRCESKMVDIDQIILDSNIIFARSKNIIQIFESKKEECKVKGVLRFP